MYSNDLDILKSVSKTYINEVRKKDAALGIAGAALAGGLMLGGVAPGPGGGKAANPEKQEQPDKKKGEKKPGFQQAEVHRF